MFDPEKITYFAKTDARGQHVSFGIKAKDRQRHMYVIGKTGMGKSTLLENMAAQDIINGEGMAFIDPHGSAAETLLEYIPEHRVNDVVYFAPFDMQNPVAFNVMEDVGPDKRHLVVSGLMSTFKKIWVDAWSARMEYILTNTLLALIEYPNTTLLSVNRMLADKEYRDKVVEYVKDPAVKAYWLDEFASYTERFAAEALPAIQNKIGQFTGNPLIRNIIGQPKSSFDLRKMMDEKKILIVNLSKGLVGETNADLLGSMLTTRIYLAAMSRADLPVMQMKQMPNFYFYVDEFQSFANSTFANILSEARKYHLNLIIAHQYIEQMEEDVRNAVFGNVGTTITFRVGPFDAELLEKVFEPKFMATDLVNLGIYQIYLTLMIDGIGSQPFSATTLPPIEQPAQSYKGIAIAASRRNYAGKREEVEALVTALHATDRTRPVKSGGKKNAGKPGAYGAKKPNTEVKKPNFENTILEKLREQKQAHTTPEVVSETAVIDRKPSNPGASTTTVTSITNTTTADTKPQSQPRPATPIKSQLVQSDATNLDQLRAVLAKIAKEDTLPPKTKENTAPRNERSKHKRQDTKRNIRPTDRREQSIQKKETSLRDALTAALGDTLRQTNDQIPVVHSAATPAPVKPMPAAEHEAVPPAPQSPQLTDTPDTNTVPKHTPASASTVPHKPPHDEVSPQELERMLRVHQSERPPL